MLSLSLISSAILLGVANGSPTPLEALDQLAEKRTFSLEQIEVPRREPRSLLDEITHTYMKYNVEPPSYVEAAIRDGPAAGTASTPAKSIGGDKEYLISVQVGNHNLTLDPDTGSADLYVLPLPISISCPIAYNQPLMHVKDTDKRHVDGYFPHCSPQPSERVDLKTESMILQVARL